MSERAPIPKRLRFEVFKRDSFKCQYCGATAPEVVLHVDHIKPVASGGQNDIVNLITACQNCNLGKADVPLSDTSAVAKARRQMEALQERREQLEMMMEWQQGLTAIEEDSVAYLKSQWRELSGGKCCLNEKGIEELQKLVSRYGLQDLLHAMRAAAQTMKSTDLASVEAAWSKVGPICRARIECGGDEQKIEARRLRGLLRSVMGTRYMDYQEALCLISQALEGSVPPSEVKGVITESSSYTNFTERITNLIEMYGR